MKGKLLYLWRNYKHGAWIVSYLLIYLIGFMIVENAGHRHYHVIHTWIDEQIPFCEYFIIPYFLWFVYMAAGICWFVFRCKNRDEYYRLTAVLALGMTIFLIVSCVYPNRQDLRPETFANNNIFTQLVKFLYKTDTPTNVLPSIHVFNSMALDFAINGNETLRKHRWVSVGSHVLAFLIVLSTMFLKQHSIIDVSMGILMSVGVQLVCDRLFVPEGSGEYSSSRRTA